MQPDTPRISVNSRSLGALQEMVNPVRERLEEATRDLAEALAKAGDSVRKLRVEDVAELMRRLPLAALAVAAGIGLIAGLFLWPRER